MKWAIDRIENNLAVLENITTKEKKEVSIFLLPTNIQEKNIVTEYQNTYYIDKTEEEIRRKLIEKKFKKLRKD